MTDVDRQRPITGNSAADAVLRLEKIEPAEPLHIPVGAGAELDVLGKIEIQSEPSVLVIENAVEVPVPAVAHPRPPVNQPRLRPPAVADVTDDVTLVDPAGETHLGVEVRRNLVCRRKPTEVAPAVAETHIVDMPGPLQPVKVTML